MSEKLIDYEVTVGNIGSVYSGHLLKEALINYKEYKTQSIEGYGRAAQEQVTLWKNSEPLYEHFGTVDNSVDDSAFGHDGISHKAHKEHMKNLGN